MKSRMTGVVAVLALVACSKHEVGFDTLEQARTQARENAVKNAQRFRMTDPRFTGMEIISRGDSSQMPNCPQGDGWATMDLFRPNENTLYSVKCSTTSLALGCMTTDDFKKKSYAEEDGHCAPLNKVPFPIRKLTE